MNGIPVPRPGMNAESVVTNRKDSGLSKICNMSGEMRDAVYSEKLLPCLLC